MKFVVSSTVLLSHLQAISRVINSKNSLPILDNFLLELEGKTFHELSDLWGEHIGTLLSRKSRATKQLKEKLSSYHPTHDSNE